MLLVLKISSIFDTIVIVLFHYFFLFFFIIHRLYHLFFQQSPPASSRPTTLPESFSIKNVTIFFCLIFFLIIVSRFHCCLGTTFRLPLRTVIRQLASLIFIISSRFVLRQIDFKNTGNINNPILLIIRKSRNTHLAFALQSNIGRDAVRDNSQVLLGY